MHILLVEDDATLADGIRRVLEGHGMQVDLLRNGAEADAWLRTTRFAVVVLDIGLPGGLDGFEVVRRLRQRGSDQPVLLLTARDAIDDRVHGFEVGADDYLVKPFAARELLARINAVLRRTRMLPPNLVVTESGRLLAFGRWRLDTTARHLLDSDGTMVALSGAEYRLLRVFLDHPQRVLNRDQLLNLTQGRDADLFDRSIDLLVSRLRQRLLDDAREPAYIKTVRSEGYVFSLPVEILEASV
jgi:DNA-binding response OmpR family regulator